MKKFSFQKFLILVSAIFLWMYLQGSVAYAYNNMYAQDDVKTVLLSSHDPIVKIPLYENDLLVRNDPTKTVSSEAIKSGALTVSYKEKALEDGVLSVDVNELHIGLNDLGSYELCHYSVVLVPEQNDTDTSTSSGALSSWATLSPPSITYRTIVIPYCSVAKISVNVIDDTGTPSSPANPDPTPTPTPSDIPTIPVSSGGGPGGYVEGQPVIPFRPIDGNTLFSAPKLDKQCISPVKNLDDPKLIAYYNDLRLNFEGDFHRKLTRSEFVKMIIRSADVSKEGIDLSVLDSFVDVNREEDFAPYLAYALSRGIISGQIISADDSEKIERVFRPNEEISRAEASKILSGLILKDISEIPSFNKINAFTDVNRENTLSSYVQYAYDNCLLHGRNTLDGQPIGGQHRIFEPNDGITIAETAKVLYNMTHKDDN